MRANGHGQGSGWMALWLRFYNEKGERPSSLVCMQAQVEGRGPGCHSPAIIHLVSELVFIVLYFNLCLFALFKLIEYLLWPFSGSVS